MTLEQAVDVLNASKYHRAVYRISRPGWVTGRVVGESYDASVMPADAAIAVAEKVVAPSSDLSVLRERLEARYKEVDARYSAPRGCDPVDEGRLAELDVVLALLDDVKAGEGK